MVTLDPPDQELAPGLYRRLAEGEPVSSAGLASEGRESTEVAETLEDWPGVFRSDDGRMVSFRGRAIPEMPHSFRVGERQLFTWCAWDALFIPELIDAHELGRLVNRKQFGGLLPSTAGDREHSP